MAELVAVTRLLDERPDLLAVAGHEGVVMTRAGAGLAGRGAAWQGPLAQLAEVLSGVDRDDGVGRPGSGPVGFAALPFDMDSPVDAVIPSLVVGHGPDGESWITCVSTTGAEPDLGSIDAPIISGEAGPQQFSVRPCRPPEEWCSAVAEATARIRAGKLDKVVLAREVEVTGDAPFVVADLLRRLRTSYSDCFVYAIDGYLGASPELLVARHDDLVEAQPMAGTTARRGDPQADAQAAATLMASPTYRHEHQVTIDMVHDTLLPYCSYLDYQPEPSVVSLANVAHLATRVEGRLSHPPASVLELVRALHPTPAVCGRPRAAARAVIAELEGFDRGRYAGAVGWIDAEGNGEWAVAIRGAQLRGNSARVCAGNGIVGDSDPLTELAETRAKLQAMLGVLIRP